MIGISNFTIAQVDEALTASAGEHIITNPIEVQPCLVNRKLVAYS